MDWIVWIQNFIREHGYAHEILPHFYLGDITVARNKPYLQALGIKAIANVAVEAANWHPNDFTYYNIPFEDTGRPKIAPELASLFAFIDSHRDEGAGVLIHCMGGVSRSATFAIAYVMWKQQMRFDSAFAHVKALRQIVNPKPGFQEQLCTYDESLFGNVEPMLWR